MNEYRIFVARSPRHAVASADDTSVEVRRSDALQQAYSATLLDFSRRGARLRIEEEFEIGQRLLIQIQAGRDFVFRQEATVRWRACESAAEVTYGCGFDCPVEWEVLGELLMRGVLTTE